MIHRLVLLQTFSSLHCGIGRGLTDIDLPVARDPISGHPIIPATSFKGCLRDTYDQKDSITTAAFGREDSQGDAASRASFTDLRLLCLPVKSYFGTFAYVTSPFILRLFRRELEAAGQAQSCPAIPTITPQSAARNPTSKLVAINGNSVNKVPHQPQILLNELDLSTDVAGGHFVGDWSKKLGKLFFPNDPALLDFFEARFVIVEDDVLNFLCETALPVSAHNKINENGVVQDGALWFEETVPSEALFYGSLRISDERNIGPTSEELVTHLTATPKDLQIGGNASTGCGLCRIHFQLPAPQ